MPISTYMLQSRGLHDRFGRQAGTHVGATHETTPNRGVRAHVGAAGRLDAAIRVCALSISMCAHTRQVDHAHVGSAHMTTLIANPGAHVVNTTPLGPARGRSPCGL